jgi:hypothetical protein
MADVGVDLHRKRSHVVALDPTGQVMLSRRIGNAPSGVPAHLRRARARTGRGRVRGPYGWSWFADLLADAGIPAHMAHPLATKAISPRPGQQRRGRRHDPGPPAAHQPAPPRRGSPRQLPVRPAAWSALGRGWSGCVHASNPSSTRCWPTWASSPSSPPCSPPAGRQWLAELRLPAGARGRLDAGLRLVDAITVEVTHADADLRAGFARDPRVRRRLPIPGIGLVTAATVVAEVSRRSALPHAGAVVLLGRAHPGERTSDAHTRRGHITKAGLPLAALDAGRGGHQRRPRSPVGPLHRPAPRPEDRPGGAGPSAADPVLRRPARRAWLPCLPRPAP